MINEKASRQEPDWFLALTKHFPLNTKNAKLLFPNYGETDWFRHTTDNEGAKFIVNDITPKVTIAAEKLSQSSISAETDGNILMHVKGKYIAWFPFDVYSSTDINGMRWIDPKKVWEEDNELFSQSFMEAFKLAYLQYIMEVFIPSKWLQDVVSQNPSIANRIANVDKHIENGWDVEKAVESLLKMLRHKGFTEQHSDELNKHMEELNDIYSTAIETYSDKIHAKLVDKFIDNKNSYYRKFAQYPVKSTQYGIDWDEALINNIDPRSVLFKRDDAFVDVVQLMAGAIDYESTGEISIPAEVEQDDEEIDDMMSMFGLSNTEDRQQERDDEIKRIKSTKPTIEFLEQNPQGHYGIRDLDECKQTIAQMKDKERLVFGFCSMVGSVKAVSAIMKSDNESIQAAIDLVLQFVGLKRTTKKSAYFEKL